MIFVTFAVFHEFPGLDNGPPKFHDFLWLSRISGHPVKHSVMAKHPQSVWTVKSARHPDPIMLQSNEKNHHPRTSCKTQLPSPSDWSLLVHMTTIKTYIYKLASGLGIRFCLHNCSLSYYCKHHQKHTHATFQNSLLAGCKINKLINALAS